jgi:hypothetical protein
MHEEEGKEIAAFQRDHQKAEWQQSEDRGWRIIL